MLLRYFYDEKLAHASYLVGCQATGEAIVVDPARNIEQYLRSATRNKLKVTAVTETHIHADYVSGARELADRVGAHLYLSDEGDKDWKYQYLKDYKHTLLKHADHWMIGNIRFEVLHTPGHTPESISIILTDTAGADQPMGIFTGDFLFVGDVGRPDLLEEAAGIKGTKEVGGQALFKSIKSFRELPDYLQIWPAHGAGSACGKSLGAVPSSTLGYEKQFNWAFQIDDEANFVKSVLADQPAPPKYFAEMKRVNKEGPAVLKERSVIPELSVKQLMERIDQKAWVVDTRSQVEYAASNILGTVGIPLNKSFTTFAGWVLPYDQPIYLIIEPDKLSEAVDALLYIGLDNIQGYFTPEVLSLWPRKLSAFPLKKPAEVAEAVKSAQVNIVDVRAAHEYEGGHLPDAQHIPLTRLQERFGEVKQDKETILVNCQSGGRSFVAATLLRANGCEKVINLDGGFSAWKAAELPVQQ